MSTPPRLRPTAELKLWIVSLSLLPLLSTAPYLHLISFAMAAVAPTSKPLPKTPKTTRFANSAFSTPRSSRTPSTTASSPALSTPASSVHPSPSVPKRKSTIADLTLNWRDRSKGQSLTKRPSLTKVVEEDGKWSRSTGARTCSISRIGLLPAPKFLKTTSDSSDYPDSSDSDRDLGLHDPVSAIRVSLPSPSSATSAASLSPIHVPVNSTVSAPVTPARTTFPHHSSYPMSLPQLLHYSQSSPLASPSVSNFTRVAPTTARMLPSLSALQTSSNELASFLASSPISPSGSTLFPSLHAPTSIFDRLATVPISTVSHVPLVSTPTRAPVSPIISCSVCGSHASSAARGELTLLEPCKHLVCRACMTHSLNIVGEKNFSCMTCDAPIINFSLLSTAKAGNSVDPISTIKPPGIASMILASSFAPPVPITEPLSSEPTVIRIDNCPWDVTPTMLTTWVAPISPLAAHVLLDRKGKTLSHAFLELCTRDDARTILRACRTKILGSGRRARGVTLTLSSQNELRLQLFPNHNGALGTSDVDALGELIRTGTVFIKDVNLPHWLLASILRKVGPADKSLVGSATQEKLFALVVEAADKMLADRPAFDPAVLPDVLSAARECAAFSPQQQHQLDQLWQGVCALVFAPAS